RHEHRLEVARARHEHVLTALGLALHEHLVAAAELLEIRRASHATKRLHESGEALTRDLIGDRELGRHARGRRPVAWRELEREPIGEADLADRRQGLLEVL